MSPMRSWGGIIQLGHAEGHLTWHPHTFTNDVWTFNPRTGSGRFALPAENRREQYLAKISHLPLGENRDETVSSRISAQNHGPTSF